MKKPSGEADDAAFDNPLVISRQGSIEAGGTVVYCDVNDGNDPNSSRWPAGHVVVDQVYASYQYPADLNCPYPVLLNAGGGHSARVYDTTPDGREGWSTLLLRAGFAVYGVDRVNCGRSGLDIRRIIGARLGNMPASAIEAMNRYPFESCWTTFRWGPEYGTAYDDTQFPIEAAADYYPQTLPNVRGPDEDAKSIAAFAALIDKIATPVILQTWSSSGLLGYLTAVARPDSVKAVLAVESSPEAFDQIDDRAMSVLARVPILVVIGDRAPERVTASRAFQARMAAIDGKVDLDVLPEAGIVGNGHTLMLEKNNHEILQRMLRWLAGVVPEVRGC